MALLPDDPQRRRHVLLGALLLALLGYGAYSYVYEPRSREIAAQEARLETLETQNRTARALADDSSRARVERRLAGYREQLVRVEGLIPSSEELPDLLDAISAEAQRTGVEISLIQPVGATAETYYTRRTYDLAVLGSFHQIGAFLTEIASLPRIITPTNLNVAVHQEAGARDEPQLEAKFAIETYVLPDPDAPADSAALARADSAASDAR